MSLYKYLIRYRLRCIVCTMHTNKARCHRGSLLARGLLEPVQQHSLVHLVGPSPAHEQLHGCSLPDCPVLAESLSQLQGAPPEQVIEGSARVSCDQAREHCNTTQERTEQRKERRIYDF